MPRYNLLFERLGEEFWLRSPPLGSENQAVVYGLITAQKRSMYGWRFVCVGPKPSVIDLVFNDIADAVDPRGSHELFLNA